MIGSLMVSAQNYQLHSVYIYSFIRYIQWPPESDNGDFVIGVMGETPVSQYLEKMAEAKKAGNRNILVKKLSATSNLTGLDILFVPQDYDQSLGAVLEQLGAGHTLLITEKEGSGARGSNINFIITNDKLGFELNKAAMERANLKVSTELTKLAVII